jgi:hypothetical protein
VSYDQGVSVNTERLRLLAPLVLLAAFPPVHSALLSGAGAFEVASIGAAALVGAVAVAAGLVAAVRAAVEASIGGKVFVGTKWDAFSGGSAQYRQAVNDALHQVHGH